MANFIMEVFMKPPKQGEENQSRLDASPKAEGLMEMLGDYALFFDKDLDELWIEYDYDNSGTLD